MNHYTIWFYTSGHYTVPSTYSDYTPHPHNSNHMGI